ncbi:NAD(P)H-dependent glycerol-3-phosphate dehydrogenase [Methylocella sp.]|uniref:NAD(P)H-dependent glycerol-3-phosphate dehydrogenase n=1 Tax=Methylocella sp. TaxID=1978226 RepID=UPI003783B726
MAIRVVAVLGAGAWGTALANLAARGEDARVLLCARDPGHVVEMAATGVNARRLPGVPLLSNVAPTADLAAAAKADVILAAVPTQALRETLAAIAPLVEGAPPVVVCAKGIERGTGRFVTEIVNEVMPRSPAAILSGPSFARDVARGLPTAVTLAARDGVVAAALAAMIAGPTFRVYSSSDVRGVEIGGAAKNVLAIASGVAAGRGLGASAGAALVARGFAELSRFGRAYDAEPATLAGLSGLGDLVLTCGSAMSRNFSFGFALGEGASVEEATEKTGLAEGAFTCGVMLDLARAAEVDMPISAAVDAVLAERVGVDEAIAELLARPSKPEG